MTDKEINVTFSLKTKHLKIVAIVFAILLATFIGSQLCKPDLIICPKSEPCITPDNGIIINGKIYENEVYSNNRKGDFSFHEIIYMGPTFPTFTLTVDVREISGLNVDNVEYVIQYFEGTDWKRTSAIQVTATEVEGGHMLVLNYHNALPGRYWLLQFYNQEGETVLWIPLLTIDIYGD